MLLCLSVWRAKNQCSKCEKKVPLECLWKNRSIFRIMFKCLLKQKAAEKYKEMFFSWGLGFNPTNGVRWDNATTVG